MHTQFDAHTYVHTSMRAHTHTHMHIHSAHTQTDRHTYIHMVPDGFDDKVCTDKDAVFFGHTGSGSITHRHMGYIVVRVQDYGRYLTVNTYTHMYRIMTGT